MNEPQTRDPVFDCKAIVDEMLSESPNGFVQTLLETPFWPPGVQAGKYFARREDESSTGTISVVVGSNGDVALLTTPPKGDLRRGVAFRVPGGGGGASPRVYRALLMLAEAIRLDNEFGPEHKRP